MNIVITGATGFIGSHITDELVRQGHNVTVIIRKNSSLHNIEGLPINIIEVDYDDISSIQQATSNIEIIIHCAGMLFGKDYDEFKKANVDSTINLVESIRTNSNFKQFIYISSLTVAGPSASLDLVKKENDHKNPITNYGKSKAEAEDFLINQREWLNYTILRLPAVYGPRDTAIFSLFKLAKSGFATLIGFKTKYLSLIHSSDVVNGLNLTLNNEIAFKKVYFLSSDEFYSWEEVMDLIKKGFNKKRLIKLRLPHSIVYIIAFINSYASKIIGLTPIFDLDKARDFTQKYWICSNKLIKQDLNYEQLTSLEEGISSTIKWYKENKWL
jgi:nucleoside-diphosphate-sugar epimerase